jgi:exodeoxyribonuclease VII small subunit
MVPEAAPEGVYDNGDELSFEEILSRLQQIVEELEKGDTPLEESLITFEEGVRLSRLGARRLDEAERRIELLLSKEDGVQTRPLDKEPDAQ